MRAATLFASAALAALAAANPVPELAYSTTDISPASEYLWTLAFYEADQCGGEPDVEFISKTPHSRCIKYNNGLGRELESITFQHPRSDANCKVS